MSTAGTAPGPARLPGGSPGWARLVGLALSRTLWSVTVAGTEHVPATGPLVIAANHTGLADAALIMGMCPRPLRVLTKREMFVGPVGLVLRLAGQIPVDRRNGRAALATAQAVLREGGAVGVFPEGTRGRGSVQQTRAGAAWLAVHGDAPVVPMAILGTRRTGESSTRLPGFRRRLHVELGPPLHVERRPGEGDRDTVGRAAADLQVALASLVVETSRRTGIALPDDDTGAYASRR